MNLQQKKFCIGLKPKIINYRITIYNSRNLIFVLNEDVVGYFIEEKGVLYFKGGCGDYMLSDTTTEIMKENYELYTCVLQ